MVNDDRDDALLYYFKYDDVFDCEIELYGSEDELPKIIN